jgi:hypothetical protein
MFSAFILLTLFAAAFLSAESLVSVIIGGIVSIGLSQWLKNATQAYGPAMLVVSIMISIVVAVVATLVSAMFTGSEVHWSDLSQTGPQIFALAQVGYKLFLADAAPAN